MESDRRTANSLLSSSDDDYLQREIPSFIEPRPPLITNPVHRPKPTERRNLLSLFEEDCESEEEQDHELVQVYLRLKPIRERNALYEVRNNKNLITSIDTIPIGNGRNIRNNNSKMYTFSHIFGPESSQKQIFDHIVKDNIHKLADGQSFTLLTYGTSGSGKTFTLMGTESAPGLIPRSLEYLFKVVDAAQQPVYKPCDSGAELLTSSQREQELQWVKKLRQVSASQRDTYRRMSVRLSTDFTGSTDRLEDRTQYYIWVSFVEIYNEAIYDLLNYLTDRRSASKLRIREDADGQVYVKGATQTFVRSGLEAYDVMVAGRHNLQVAATGVHANSSRSHCIFTITLLTKTSDTFKTACMRLCDLAGSERANRTHNTGARMAESRAINTSLHVLERCLHMLRRKQQQKPDSNLVPYRESKLTRLLGSGLSGIRGEPVAMVVTINPSRDYSLENKHVLQLASVAKDIHINTSKSETSLDYNSTQDTTIPTNSEIIKLRAEKERFQFELVQSLANYNKLKAAMDESQEQATVTMKEIVKEVKAMTADYYNTQIQFLTEKHESQIQDLNERYQKKVELLSFIYTHTASLIENHTKNKDTVDISSWNNILKVIENGVDEHELPARYDTKLSAEINASNSNLTMTNKNYIRKSSLQEDSANVAEIIYCNDDNDSCISIDDSRTINDTDTFEDDTQTIDDTTSGHDLKYLSWPGDLSNKVSIENEIFAKSEVQRNSHAEYIIDSSVNSNINIIKSNISATSSLAHNSHDDTGQPLTIKDSINIISNVSIESINAVAVIDDNKTNIEITTIMKKDVDEEMAIDVKTENCNIKLTDYSVLENNDVANRSNSVNNMNYNFDNMCDNNKRAQYNIDNIDIAGITNVEYLQLMKETSLDQNNMVNGDSTIHKFNNLEHNRREDNMMKLNAILNVEEDNDINTNLGNIKDKLNKAENEINLHIENSTSTTHCVEEVNTTEQTVVSNDFPKFNNIDKVIDHEIINSNVLKNKPKENKVKYSLRRKRNDINELNTNEVKHKLEELLLNDDKSDISESSKKHEINISKILRKQNNIDNFTIDYSHTIHFGVNSEQQNGNRNTRKLDSPSTKEFEHSNEAIDKLKDIQNLREEFCDIITGTYAPIKNNEVSQSPEIIPANEENIPPINTAQSLLYKSILRSRRKLFTPRAEALEESVSGEGNSNERVRIPRPSYKRGRARRKI